MVSKVYLKRTGVFLKLLMCAVVALGFAFAPLGALTARADGGLEISTNYPGIMVKAGTDAEFILKVSNKTGIPQSVGIAVQTAPQGWTTSITGSGNPITMIYVDNEATQSCTLKVTIPAETPEGVNAVTVVATGETGITDTLHLEINVTQQEIKQGSFTTQYPIQKGPSGAVFEFSTSLANNAPEDQTYNLSANAPAGWKVAYKVARADQEVASVSVTASSSLSITAAVTPAYNVTAGTYTINCSAISAKDTLNVDLTVEITGTYEMYLTSETEVLTADAYAGRESAINLKVYNNGSADISNIQMSATAPTNWEVTFDPMGISLLPAGESKTVVARVKPANDAIAGDYLVSFAAASAESQSQSMFRIAVKTSTTWGIVGIAIILVLVAGLIVIFMKFGRR